MKKSSKKFLKLQNHSCKITFPNDVLVGKVMDDKSR